MDSKEDLIIILAEKLNEKNLNTEKYRKRLHMELREVEWQGEHDYFLDLYKNGIRFDNENNLLIPFLLGICHSFDIDKEAAFFQSDMPDVDVDYLPIIRDYLKNEWAPKTFGSDHVCNIGNYTTFGIKSALIDMAKVYGLDRAELLRITTTLPAKDDDGKDITLEKAMEESKELKVYCEKYPEVASAAKRLVGRNRGKGKHAAGLIISKTKIDELVPLIIDTDGTPTSAWPEGLHSQDLQPVGLVKFDLLVITNIVQIARCTKLIKERHGITSICAKPGRPDWTDDSYLNDHDALALANEAKLKGIFQFDSEGIRELVKKGGVTTFDDLVAYTSLYRPGAMGCAMHERYVLRKQGEEEYAIHPLLEPIVGNTYGVLVYQEQIMRMLNVVGNIPLRDCYKVLKGISKKREDIFETYRPLFVQNGIKNLEWDEEAVKQLWDQIVSFSGYGFNLSHATCYSVLSSRLLYLKAHYPIEFFSAILSCEDDSEKIKEYRHDADKFGIKVSRIDINKSDVKFAIRDNMIYMGLSNVKGIGEEVAKRIVSGQPYVSFEDFLTRFGTDASVMKPLIGLRAFTDADPVTLYEFYEYFKKESKRRQDREKRNVASREKIFEEFRYLLKEVTGHDTDINEDRNFFNSLLNLEQNEFNSIFSAEGENRIPGFDVKQGWKVINKYNKNVLSHTKKTAADKSIRLADFIPTGHLDDKELQEIYEYDVSDAEKMWCGFSFVHILQKSPDYHGGMTFEDFQKNAAVSKNYAPVEVQVVEKPKELKTKTGKTYHVITLEDANSQRERMTIWSNDYDIFKPELEYWESDRRLGNLMRIRVTPPTFPYKNYSFHTPPRHKRAKEFPDKRTDWRLLVLSKPIIQVEKKETIASKLKDLSTM